MRLKLFPLFAFLVAPSFAFASDPRYSLTEYTMEHCPACVAALQDVADITAVGIDVRTVNTTVDKEAAEEARRFNLALRPAWRLATADGKEVGRWYGARRSAIIVATIRAKFPTPDEELPTAPEPLKETTPEEEEGAATESQALKPVLAEPVPPSPSSSSPPNESEAEAGSCDLATCDAELYESNDAQEDFRERTPVVEYFEDASFLDDSRDEWNDRRADPQDAPRDRFERDEEEDESEGRAYLFRRRAPSERDEEPSCNAALGDRIADRAAASILKGLNGRVDEIKKEAFVKFDRIGAETQDALVAETSAQFKDARNEINRLIEGELEKIEKAALRKLSAWLIGSFCCVFAACVFVCWYSYSEKSVRSLTT